MRPIVAEYQHANSRARLHCQWHRLCASSPGYERWRAQQLYQKGAFDLAFSGLAAKAYAELFELPVTGLPCCTPSQVMEISGLARQLAASLPLPSLLPGDAQKPEFKSGLNDLKRWRPRDLQAGVSLHGDPVRRWLIREIAEEFCYATATQPTAAIVGDLIRLGWPKVKDRSIRNTLTPDLLEDAMAAANVRHKQENRATAVTQQVINKASVQAKMATVDKDAAGGDELSIITEMERLAASLPDANMRKRTLSFMQALRDEAGFPQEEPDEGN